MDNICQVSRDNHKECMNCDGYGFLTPDQVTQRILEMILIEMQLMREDRTIMNQYPRQVSIVEA